MGKRATRDRVLDHSTSRDERPGGLDRVTEAGLKSYVPKVVWNGTVNR